MAWNKSKGLKIDPCPVSKSTKNFNVSAEKFITTAFQGSDHNILIIHFEVNLSSICLIYLRATNTHTKKTQNIKSSNWWVHFWLGALSLAFALVVEAYLQHVMLSAQVTATLQKDCHVFKSLYSGNGLEKFLQLNPENMFYSLQKYFC